MGHYDGALGPALIGQLWEVTLLGGPTDGAYDGGPNLRVLATRQAPI